METYKQQFIEFMVASDALTFGEFVTKSGRQTPYFINSGNFSDGPRIAQLGEWYARAINNRIGSRCDNLYGPAYKGIPIVAAAAQALAHMGADVGWVFNRKEAKGGDDDLLDDIE